MDQAKGLLMAGGLFLLAGAIQMAASGPMGVLFLGLGAAFVGLGVKRRRDLLAGGED